MRETFLKTVLVRVEHVRSQNSRGMSTMKVQNFCMDFIKIHWTTSTNMTGTYYVLPVWKTHRSIKSNPLDRSLLRLEFPFSLRA